MINSLIVRPRLLIATAVGVASWFVLPEQLREATRVLVAWDFGTALYIILVALMIMQSTTEKIRCRAAAQDEGQILILMLTIFTGIASLAAIVVELYWIGRSDGVFVVDVYANHVRVALCP